MRYVLKHAGVAVLVAALAGGGFAAASRMTAASTATSTSSSFSAVADSYVSASNPNAVYGSGTTLKVEGSPVKNAYVKFVVSGLSGPVTKATLRLYSQSNSSVGFDARFVPDNTWQESTLSYANAPWPSSTVTASSGPLKTGSWAALDVTSLVVGNGTFSFALTSNSATALKLASRETGTTKAPQIVITTAVSTPSTTSSSTGSTSTSPTTSTTSPTTTSVSTSTTAATTTSTVPTTSTTVPTTSSSSTSTTTPGSGGPCGVTSSAPGRYAHVVWIFMENHGYGDIVGSSSAPYENQLAAECGLATNYSAVTHPSLPNYVAATSGDYWGIQDDNPPSSHPLSVASIYSQVKAAGLGWREYEEDAPGNCPQASSYPYAVKHDPAAYYTGIAADCANWDVPMGTTSGGSFLSALSGGSLPAFAFITPNMCNDMHDCSVDVGDAWLQSWVPKIIAGSNYQSGNTAIFITFDEDDGSGSNQVYTTVIAPSVPVGARSSTAFSHYSLLKTTEQMLGLSSYLAHAGDSSTQSMAPAFNLLGSVVSSTPATAPSNTSLPTISGTAQVNQTLTASVGTWTGSPTTFAFQWRRCDSSGGSCTDILGATGSTYTLGLVDQGSTIRVAVTGSNGSGSSTAVSDATGVVQTAPVATSPWVLLFQDDFNGTDLNPLSWGKYSGQPGGDPGGWWDPSHVLVSNGVLDLQTYQDPVFGSRWVSGGVSSAPALSQIYGKYEVRFRVDGGYGVNAVLLLWPSSEIWPPEIDFAENGGENTVRDHMTATLHYGNNDTQLQSTVTGDFTQWHVMGVEWTPGKLVYTLDGQPWATLSNSNVPSVPMEMDMQSEAGTCGVGWAPCPNGTTPPLVQTQVDWVKAYAYKP
jgi:hypothetical protein